MKSRLARGRKRLQERLLRRGFAPGVAIGAGAGLLAGGEASAAVPPALLDATTRAAAAIAAGTAVSGVVPPALQALAQTEVSSMLATKLKLAAGIPLTAGAAAIVVGFALTGGANQKVSLTPTIAAATPARRTQGASRDTQPGVGEALSHRHRGRRTGPPDRKCAGDSSRMVRVSHSRAAGRGDGEALSRRRRQRHPGGNFDQRRWPVPIRERARAGLSQGPGGGPGLSLGHRGAGAPAGAWRGFSSRETSSAPRSRSSSGPKASSAAGSSSPGTSRSAAPRSRSPASTRWAGSIKTASERRTGSI